MSASVSTLPIWKKGATVAEWLNELAGMALEHPERWGRVVVVFQKKDAEGYPGAQRMYSRGIQHNTDIMGLLETAKQDLWDYMKGRK